MNGSLKKCINIIGLGWFVRKIRGLGYMFFDLLGSTAFSLLKIIKLIPKNIEFKKDMVKKILIIRKDRIGDIVLSTPVFRAVRQSYPQAKVHLLISGYTKDLVVNNKNIDKIIIWPEDSLDNDYDLAIALHPGITENELTFKSGARFRIGFSGRGGSFFLTHRVEDDRETRLRHEVISALEIVKIAGCSTDNKTLEVSITEQGEAFVDEFFKRQEFSIDDFVVMIHPGARQEYIRWKKQGFAELADMLIREKKAKVVLLSGKNEENLVSDIESLMQEQPVIASGMSLSGLVSLMKRMKLFVGNSTGPMHIASALKIPVVAIFGSRHPLDSLEEWGPWGEDTSCGIRADVDCRKCHPSDCRNDFKCMSKIEAKEVFKAINILLSKQRTTNKMKDEKKILIMNLGGIGDLLLSTPALRALKARFPSAEINLLVFEPVKEYADGLDFIDEVFTLSVRKINFLKNIRAVFFLRNKKFDTAINMRTLVSRGGATKIKLLFKIIAPLETIGRNTAGRGDFFDIKIPEPDIGDKFELEYDIETVKHLGVEVNDRVIEFRVDDQKRKEVNELLKDAGIGEDDRIIAVHPGGKPSHRWPKENFAKVLDLIGKKAQVKFLILAGKDEKALAQSIIEQSGLNIFDLSGRLDIYQLGALLERAAVLICNDSAPMHIAAAVGTPLVAMFGAGYFHRFNPKNISDKAITLYKEADCAPCGKLECDDMICLKAISVDEVYNAVMQLLKG